MKLLTTKQKMRFFERTVSVGESYNFPEYGLDIYPTASYLNSERMDTNPFTKSLTGELFTLTAIPLIIYNMCLGGVEKIEKTIING